MVSTLALLEVGIIAERQGTPNIVNMPRTETNRHGLLPARFMSGDVLPFQGTEQALHRAGCDVSRSEKTSGATRAGRSASGLPLSWAISVSSVLAA